jgi:hypothetical protein
MGWRGFLSFHFQELCMAASNRRFSLSLDVWAVVLSLVLALLVRTGVIKTVAW